MLTAAAWRYWSSDNEGKEASRGGDIPCPLYMGIVGAGEHRITPRQWEHHGRIQDSDDIVLGNTPDD